MANPAKRKGDKAELEVQALWQEHTGVPARRALGAGRKDDVGDIHGIPNTVVQVANWQNVAAAVREKPLEAESQRANAENEQWLNGSVNTLFACTFIRLRGGQYRVVLTPEQYFALWREAQ